MTRKQKITLRRLRRADLARLWWRIYRYGY
jgi:hypothetical protein